MQIMTASSTRSIKPKSPARPRSIAGAHAPEDRPASSIIEKLLESERGLSNSEGVSVAATPTLAAERARRSFVSRAAGAAVEAADDETLDLIGGLLDSVAVEVAHLNQELSSSLERLAGKHEDGVGH
jgi:hypothetical protein